MPEAARVGDRHQCLHVDGNHPHVGGPIEAPASTTVMTGHRPQARAGDRCRCDGPPSFITTGASTVHVDGRPAARVGDHTMHMPPGAVTAGLGSVHIGGPAEGGTLGVGDMGTALCLDAAATRISGDTMQSYGNCGVESARQIINRHRRPPVHESDLLNEAIERGEASEHRDAVHRGSTSPEQRRRLLSRYGVESDLVPNRLTNIVQAVAEGRGVISSHVSGILWNTTDTSGHAVLVTGIKFDAHGRVESVTINDSGRGRCSDPIPGERFVRSLRPEMKAVITRGSIR